MRLWLVALAVTVAALLALTVSCSSSLAGPPIAKQANEAFAEVPFPPPPARVEFVPERPRSDAKWVDGQWRWQTNRWRWERGGWYLVPSGIAFSPWEARRNAEGVLVFAPAVWRDSKGKEAPVPQLLARAAFGPEELAADGGGEEAGGRAAAGSEADGSMLDAPSIFDGPIYDPALLAAPVLTDAAVQDTGTEPPLESGAEEGAPGSAARAFDASTKAAK